MTLSVSQKLEVLEFFPWKGQTLRSWTNHFVQPGWASNTQLRVSREVTYLQRIQPAWMMKISLPARTNLHECLHYHSGISCTPVCFFLMWTIKDYKWTIFLAFPSSSQLCSVRRQAYARLLCLCCSVCANSLLVGALWRISRTKHWSCDVYRR